MCAHDQSDVGARGASCDTSVTMLCRGDIRVGINAVISQSDGSVLPC